MFSRINLFGCGHLPHVNSFNKNEKSAVSAAIPEIIGVAVIAQNVNPTNDGGVIQKEQEVHGVFQKLPPDVIRNISEILSEQDPGGVQRLELAYPPFNRLIDRRVRCISGVSQNGLSLKKLSEDERTDKKIVLAAIKNNPNAFKHCSEEMKNDKEVVLTAVKKSGALLFDASEAMKSDEEVCITAVTQNGMALRYVSQDLRDTRSVCIAAVKQNALSLCYASENMKDDLDVVRTALEKDIRSLQYASERFRELQAFF